MTSPVRHLRNGAIFLVIVCCIAVAGYIIAGWTFDESAYMAIITVFAVGYGEVNAITTPGLRLFTILIVIFGCTGYLYIGGALVQFLIEDQIQSVIGNRRMNKAISELKNHTVICGYGRVGRILADELKRANHPFVIIDRDESISTDLAAAEMLCVQADATDEDSLRSAGIMEADQVAVVLPDDAANVFITLSSRNLNPDLNIIARGMKITTEAKLRQAGANMVVLAEQIGAERIASLILRPTASSLITDGVNISHLANDFRELGIEVEEFSIPGNSKLVGSSLGALETSGSSAFLVVAVVRADGQTISSPPLDTLLKENDLIVTLCHEGTALNFAHIFNVKREPRTETTT